jgi:hypothetical protein
VAPKIQKPAKAQEQPAPGGMSDQQIIGNILFLQDKILTGFKALLGEIHARDAKIAELMKQLSADKKEPT